MDYVWTLLVAILLGMVEGLTEFLPVSSTGHLILFGDMMCFQTEAGKVFEVMIQFGAILAVCVIYFDHLFKIVRAAPFNENARRFVIGMVVAFLPAAFAGVLLHGFIKEVLFSPLVVAISLITGGVAILVVERIIKIPQYYAVEDFPLSLYLKIGLFQCMALIPGVSRSGATIMGSLLMRVERGAATEFSFFLAIPTMLGAFVYDGYKSRDLLHWSDMITIGVGFTVAFFAAFYVVKRAIGFISQHGFWPFAWYRIVLGSVILGILLYAQDTSLCAGGYEKGAPATQESPLTPPANR
jgi:undecaprenyl-diphosphatase